MAADQILTSVEALGRLAQQQQATRIALSDRLRAIDDEISSRTRRIESVIAEQEEEVFRLERRLAESDDESDHGPEEELASAQERLRRMRSTFESVENALGHYHSEANDLSDVGERLLRSAGSYLAARLTAVNEYLSIQLSDAGLATASPAVPREEIGRVGDWKKTLAEAAFLVSAVGGLVDDGLEQFERLKGIAPSSGPLEELVEAADVIAKETEEADRARKREIETSLRSAASPRVELFDPELGPESNEAS